MRIGKIIFYTVATLLFLLLIPAALICVVFGAAPCYEQTYYRELTDMHARLRETQGKKIVVIGNSAVAFGVDSALLEEELRAAGSEYTVCNFGLYGAIGTKTMLDLSRSYIREGDIVLFSPELNEQACSLYFSGLEIWRCADGNFSLLSDLKNDNIADMVGAFSSFAAEKYGFLSSGTVADSGEVYSYSSFDERCDMTKAERDHNIMAAGYDVNDRLSLDTDCYAADFVAYVNEYYEEIEGRGAAMYYSLAPMNEEAIEDVSSKAIYSFYTELEELFSFPILGDPTNAIMEKEWFYDSNFHLNESGMTMRTLLLAEDLKTEMGMTSPLRTPYPEKPEMPENAEPGEGDDSMADCFEYREESGGYVVTGLTQKGRVQTSLTVPYTYDGKPVLYFEASVFAGNLVVEEIILQNNITVLYDYSFDGCSALQRVVLRQEDPEKIGVGFHLLDGAENCLLYVPEESVAQYTLNYFWGHYAGLYRSY